MNNFKRFAVTLLSCILLMTSCESTQSEATETIESTKTTEVNEKSGFFDMFKEPEHITDFGLIYIGTDGTFNYYYDKDVFVVYVERYTHSSKGGGGLSLSPLYNPDGTLRTYNPED